MIPRRIYSYFKTMHQKQDNDGSLIEGMLNCCNASNFEILSIGKIKKGLFSQYHLLPVDNVVVLSARCRKCRKRILLFDSRHDGYDQIENQIEPKYLEHSKPECVICRKCKHNTFSIIIEYEFPSIQELRDLGIVEIGDAFTWIRITLECNLCGTKYVNFLDYETG